MKLNNAKYNLSISFVENEISIIVAENQNAYASIVTDLYNQSIGLEGDFILSQGSRELRLDKLSSCVIDPININFNDRKIINKLYAELSSYANENLEEERNLINTEIVQCIDQIVSSSRYDNLDYNLNFQWSDLLKFYGVKISTESTSITEKLIEYIKILSNICDVQLFIIVSLKAYVNAEELEEIYRMAQYNKLNLLLIESVERLQLPEEKLYIIDKDLCLIEK